MPPLIRKEAEKVANYVENFSSQLKEYNSQFSAIWNKVEIDTLGLFENQHTSRKQNRDGLITFLGSLEGLQNSINESREPIKNMKESSLSNLGLQRSLNQAIRFLDEDLKTFLEFMDYMLSSLNKIIKKGKFILSENE